MILKLSISTKQTVEWMGVVWLATHALGADFRITSSDRAGNIAWIDGYSNGLLTVVSANVVTGA